MSHSWILGLIGGYFLLLLLISFLTNRGSDQDTFFTGNHRSPWLVVAFGMIGAALSGVTFASLPGTVVNNKFYYMQFLIGNLGGYVFITFVLIPLYYKHKLVSIYGYLKERFGVFSYKSGAGIFLVSQSLGASLRLLLAMIIIDQLALKAMGVPLWAATFFMLFLIWLYTNKSGIKTIVWTDLLQTICLIAAATVTVYSILKAIPSGVVMQSLKTHELASFINWDVKSGSFVLKQVVSGFFVAVAMMGLDQFMIQKSLTCDSVRSAQKNAMSFSVVVFLTQMLFLFLGFLLILYSEQMGLGIPEKTDQLFSGIAMSGSLGQFVSVTFVLGLAAAMFSSADSALTALTTTFTHDFLGAAQKDSREKVRLKNVSHIGFAILLGCIVLLFSGSGSDVFTLIFIVAGYTYGPLAALFGIGIFTKLKPRDNWVPWICILSPILTYFIVQVLKTNYSFDLSFANILLNIVIATIMLRFASTST